MIARISAMLALATLAAAPAAAQTTVIDEGSFRLSIRGTPVGTETFAIRRSGTGDATTHVAQGRIALDSGEQTRALLQIEGPGLRPSAYQIEVTGPEKQSIRGQAAGNRFRATIVSTSGETMREYIASEGAIILDDGVAHQYYFLAGVAAQGGRVPVIIPRQSRQISATVTAAGTETLRVAGSQVSAHRIVVEPAGLSRRIIWVDDQGRVLRLEIPDDSFVAERTSLP
ncbi:MAG TPA: hypothetical protein VMM12_12920 [Longimicrobiales bacterium]|nr:hypothetical protein [Longimicrobiales bacterium]